MAWGAAAAVVFCRAMLARASKMDEVFGAFVAGGGAPGKDLPTSAGGDPSGVVDSTRIPGVVRNCKRNVEDIINPSANLLFSFSLNELSMSAGNVSPFTQISTSFLILSYNENEKVSGCTHNMFQQFALVHLQIRLVSGPEIQRTRQYSTVLISSLYAYLLIIGCRCNYVVHQYW